MVVEKKRVFIFFLILIFCLFAITETIMDTQSGVLCVISIIAINVFWGSAKNSQRSTFVIFNFTFFTFLVSKLLIEWLDGEPVLAEFSDRTLKLVYVYFALSLICIALGVMLCERCISDSKKRIDVGYEHSDLNSLSLLLQIVKIAYYVSYPFYLLTLIEKALHVQATSYIDLYTSYNSSIPYVLIKVGELNLITFALLICIEYRKEKLIIPVGLFLLSSIVSLGIGQRNIFVLNVIMLAIGLEFANRKSKKYLEREIYTRVQVRFIVLLIPVAIGFLAFWGNYRLDANTTMEAGDSVKEFFVSQGGQVVFFANTVERGEEVWSQRVPYTFASIYNYFRNLFGMIDYSIYSEQFAVEGNSLGVTQFFITSPTSLESGKGSGGCYLSELLYDWGVIGIVCGSIALGFFLRKLRLSEMEKPWKNALILMMIRGIIYIPRSSYFDWITTAFNIWNVAVIALIYWIVNIMEDRRKIPS